jgi:hypothetical protein
LRGGLEERERGEERDIFGSAEDFKLAGIESVSSGMTGIANLESECHARVTLL